MNQTPAVFAIIFLLLAAGALAAPTVTVEKTVMICEHDTCSNSTTVQQGLEHIPTPFTTSLHRIIVTNQAPKTVNGTLLIADRSIDGLLILRVSGINTTSYRKAVTGALQEYYAATLKPQHKYPIPSWMPRPGQCDMGIKLKDSRGNDICTRG